MIATLAAPTVMKEPEKPAEAEAAEGEEVLKELREQQQQMEINQHDGSKSDKKEGDDKKPVKKKINQN